MTTTRPKLTRRRGACRLCRQKKIRCEYSVNYCESITKFNIIAIIFPIDSFANPGDIQKATEKDHVRTARYVAVQQFPPACLTNGCMQKQNVECRYSTTSPSFSLRTLAPNLTQAAVITPPDDLPAYNFSSSLDNLSDADFFLDDTTASVFTDDSSTFNFNLAPLITPTSDGGGGTSTISTPSLDATTEFTLWGFDPPPSDSAPFMTGGQAGPEPTSRPTPQTWEHDTTTAPRDQDQRGSGAAVAGVPAPTAARAGPERVPEAQLRRTNWRIDREDEDEQHAADPSTTYDPLLEDLAGAMSRGKKDRHLQEQAAGIMRTLMARSQECCHVAGYGGGEYNELERQDVDLRNLPVHEIIDGNSHGSTPVTMGAVKLILLYRSVFRRASWV